MTKEKFKELFIKAVESLKMDKDWTYSWTLPTKDEKNDWAIVLGYAGGFDITEQDEFTTGNYRLCAKLAYQPKNSIMQCDYDVDWTMPYDTITGEVDDTELSIYPETNLESVVDWLWELYEDYWG